MVHMLKHTKVPKQILIEIFIDTIIIIYNSKGFLKKFISFPIKLINIWFSLAVVIYTKV